jgi:pyruvate,orthophosphate dikinase
VTWAYSFDSPPELEAPRLKALLGGKGANLAVMANELSLPVPPGFVITTEACNAYVADGWPNGLDEELRALMARIETQAGRNFADASDPLLVSVRSGAPVSMPGMLDTILNLGLNEETTAALARSTGDEAFAAACRQRLEKMYRDIVGVDELPHDPWLQLRGAIEAVFKSWDSDRAKSYRAREDIAADLGTAVVIQAMVFGNRGAESGTGVLFTRNPATGEDVLYGDVLFDAQGEDVVAGTHATLPIAGLGERMPQVADELRRYAHTLERHYADVCDIEFTIEQGKLWMLQNRIGKRGAQAAMRIAIDMAKDESFPLTKAEAVERVAAILADPPMTVSPSAIGDKPVVATGLPASPGIAVGAIATSPEAAVDMAADGRQVILVRSETSPDDVHGMAKATGVLTSTGGLASHAAVVARGWDIPAVVGASDIEVAPGRMTIGDRTWAEGDEISIDGGAGVVYGEAIAAKATVAPEVAVLQGWAEALGIDLARVAQPPVVSQPPEIATTLTADEVIRALTNKGYVKPQLFAPALCANQS